MKYLSIDLEATGLAENDLIIEFGAIPFCSETGICEELARNWYIQCPSFDELKPRLDPWVIEHNKELIDKAHAQGLPMPQFKMALEDYLNAPEIKEYFKAYKKVTLFGKSMSAIDLPFMSRDLGQEWMRQYFEHRQNDLSSVAYAMIDLGYLPQACQSGSELMKYLEMGEVCHTALEDARNTAKMYLKLLEMFKAEMPNTSSD